MKSREQKMFENADLFYNYLLMKRFKKEKRQRKRARDFFRKLIEIGINKTRIKEAIDLIF